MLMKFTCALHLYRSVLNRLSSPIARSNRLRCAMRGGLRSSFSVPGAGTRVSVELNCDARQVNGRGVVGVGRTPLQVNPAWNSWSAVRGIPNASVMLMAGCPLSVVDCGQVLKAEMP